MVLFTHDDKLLKKYKGAAYKNGPKNAMYKGTFGRRWQYLTQSNKFVEDNFTNAT